MSAGRRSPIYLLVDGSGPAAAESRRLLELMLADWRGDPNVIELGWVSVIRFDERAAVLLPLTELYRVAAPTVAPGRGGPNLGAALRLLADRVAAEVARTTPTERGDYRPKVLIHLGGEPADDWRGPLTALQGNPPAVERPVFVGWPAPGAKGRDLTAARRPADEDDARGLTRHLFPYDSDPPVWDDDDSPLEPPGEPTVSASVQRRLPIYLVLDCSGSMSGEPIEAVRQGVKALLADLRSHPEAVETAFLSVITFDSGARQVSPLTELMLFQEPTLDASGSTALGEALKLVEQAVDKEVKKTTATQKGDYKPLVFLMTDGQPTDNWQPAADSLKKKSLGNIIACAAGPSAATDPLKKVSEIVVKLDSLQPDSMKAFFKWVSDSIKTRSASVTQVAADGPIALPPPPQQIQIVP